MNKFLKLIKFLLIFLFLSGIISIFTIFFTLWKYSPELPSYQSILKYKPNLSSRIYSADGLLLKSFYTEERIFIPENRIQKLLNLLLYHLRIKIFINIMESI